jgi:5,10-methylenetetrahydromethanopterin reductase
MGAPSAPAVGIAVDPRDVVGSARAAEAAGLDFVAAGDSGTETFTAAAAVAVTTERIGIVSSIATWARTPVTTAHAAATVAHLSGGRYTLGLGPMPRHWALDWHGMAFDPVLARMREYLLATRDALDATPERPTATVGRYHRTTGFPGPALPRHEVPMLLAATGPRMTELGAEVADGLVFNGIHPHAWLTGTATERIATGLGRAGRERGALRVGTLRYVGIDDDPRRARDLVRPGLAFYFAVPYFRTLLEPFGFAAELAAGEAAVAASDAAAQVAAVSDRMVDAIALTGTAAEVAAGIARYAGVVDWIELVTAFGLPPDPAAANTRRALELPGLLEAVSPPR